jgi:bifunctional DNase/RNase
MSLDLVQLTLDKILQTRTYTEIVLKSPEKKFAIYVDAHVGKILHNYVTDVEPSRPLTHDLISSIFRGLEVQVKQVVIYDLQETTYFARIFLEQICGGIRHIVEIDARPSDCITLALMHNAPIYCAKEVLEKTIPIVG